MKGKKSRFRYGLSVLLALMVLSAPAHAFRCGNRIVTEDMHELEVLRACGEPTTVRHIGYTLRGYTLPIERRLGPGFTERHFPGYGTYTEEVVVTEYTYNFGPRKLMRRLLFEGGILVSIETMGYGYREEE